MQTGRYRIVHISLRSVFVFAGGLGAIAALLPGIVIGSSLLWLLDQLRHFLEGVQPLQINLFITTFTLDPLRLIHLNQVLANLEFLQANWFVALLLITLAVVFVTGILGSLSGVFAAFIYNMAASGGQGIAVDLVPIIPPPQPAAQSKVVEAPSN